MIRLLFSCTLCGTILYEHIFNVFKFSAMYLRSILFDLYQKKLKCDQLCKNILWPFRVSSGRNLSHSALGAMTFVAVCIFL